jgi:hypothetical protein
MHRTFHWWTIPDADVALAWAYNSMLFPFLLKRFHPVRDGFAEFRRHAVGKTSDVVR